MNRTPVWIAGTFVLALVCAMGCSTNSSPTAPVSGGDDATQVGTLLSQDYGLVSDGESSMSESQALSLLSSPAGSLAAIRPLYFWRTLDHVTTHWSVTFADSDSTGRPRIARVTVNRELQGNFNIIHSIAYDTTVADYAHPIHKLFDDRWVRHVVLVRNGATSGRWRFAGTSLIDVTSQPNTVQIQSVRIQTSTLDTTLTDPATPFPLREVMRVDPLDSVRVTVTTNHTDDVVLLHHASHRRVFRNNGDGTYTIKWVSGALAGWRHFGIDALSRGTLFDDTAAYDSNRWYVPFVVRGSVALGDYYP